ncbi:MAG: DNA replication/repair protein RecF [Anaerolineales bacterium]|nr:DNA replication/repair protein RecF [Anaerolineales bacterium]
MTNFRNFARLDIDAPGGSVLLVGGNAQGKTSLLEAIYFLATFTSFHASNERQLINFLIRNDPLAVARIVADFQRLASDSSARDGLSSGVHHLEVRIIQEANALNGAPRLRKEILVDGVKRKIGEAVGAFNAVLFLPHMLRVIEGPPEERRRYLNLVMGQALPQFAAHLGEYNRALSQRNALLKQLNERGGDLEQLAYWDEQMAWLGGQIIHARIRAIRELEYLAARIHNELTRSQEVLRFSYQPAYEPLPSPPLQYELPLDAPLDRSHITCETIQQGLLERLRHLRAQEVARGVTTIGPHRDEMRFLGNGIDLSTYGSRGQGRTAVLSLKLAEVSWMKEKTGQWPVLLLDEVLAELDASRREDLLARLGVTEQALLTTTDLDMFAADFVQKAHIWRIARGRVLA